MADIEKAYGGARIDTTNISGIDSSTSDSLSIVDSNEALQKVDLNNKQAYKPDDSDGKVEWTLRKLLAAGFLCMLFTGAQTPLYFISGTLSSLAKATNSPEVISWVPVSWTLTVTAFCPFVGYAQDLFGKRHIALIGVTLICIGCILVGTTHTFRQAIVGMSFCGMGAAIGELTGLAGLAEIVSVKHRGFASAILTAFVVPIAPYLMYAQLFKEHSTWRWAAWIPLIYNTIAFLGIFFTYFPHAHRRADGMRWQAILKRVDFMGAFLSITGLTLFLVALQAGGYTHKWQSSYVLCTLIIGLALIGSWVAWEAKFAKYPMIPPELFQGQKVVGLALTIAFLAGMTFFSLLNFWPLAISTVWNPKPILVGWRGFAFAMATTVGAVFWNSMLSVWVGQAKWILFTAATFLTAFGGALAVISPSKELETVAFCMLATFGLGGVLVPAATTAIIAAPDSLISTCSALTLAVRSLGGAIGYSIYYNIFREKLASKLPAQVAQFSVAAGLPQTEIKGFVGAFLTDPSKAASLPGITEKILNAALLGSETAYAQSLYYVWLTSIAFGVLAMMAALCLPNIRKFQTNRIAVRVSS